MNQTPLFLNRILQQQRHTIGSYYNVFHGKIFRDFHKALYLKSVLYLMSQKVRAILFPKTPAEFCLHKIKNVVFNAIYLKCDPYCILCFVITNLKSICVGKKLERKGKC